MRECHLEPLSVTYVVGHDSHRADRQARHAELILDTVAFVAWGVGFASPDRVIETIVRIDGGQQSEEVRDRVRGDEVMGGAT
jgi:hypothetical protein